MASLYIHDVLPEDAGTYVIQATNEMGTVTSEATLHVERNAFIYLCLCF